MDKMTIHRGLAELKLLGNRITEAIESGSYFAGNKKSNKKILGKTIENYEKDIQASYDKVNSLIARRNAIKSAIVDTNAKTIVDIAGKSMSVAQAIERKNSIGYEEMFLNELQGAYRKIIGQVNKHNEALPAKLETYLQSILGNKDNAKPEDVDLYTKAFMENNEMEFVDPMNIKKVIDTMSEDINAFKVEVDAVLSESNAITFIEF